MQGHIKRKQLLAQPGTDHARTKPTCPLCGRPIPPAQSDAHHLIPKSRGGLETVALHRICHRQIHALLTEAELAHSYPCIEALLRHPEIAQFVQWVQGKPGDFFQRARKSRRIRPKKA